MPKDETGGIKIPCAEVEPDYVSAWRSPDFVIVACGDGVREQRVSLTMDAARELFSWLGVELHRHG